MKPERETDSSSERGGIVSRQWLRSAPVTLAPYELIRPVRPPLPGSEPFARRMLDVGRRLRAANVAAIYLIHGTFAGSDPWGMYAGLGGLAPRTAGWLRTTTKRAVDRVLGDVSNYSQAYARLMERSLTAAGETPIPVRRFIWSSENNHIGRAAAAVHLIDELASRDFAPGQRVLFWAHSHGGNVLAMLTHLLAADQELLDRFFAATSIYYGRSTRTGSEGRVWHRVRELLEQPRSHSDLPPFLRRPLPDEAGADHTALDIVTFGTPIRYGWNRAGYDQLLHIINHQPGAGRSDHRAAPPRGLGDVFQGEGGDYVQQVAVEGTNLLPLPWCWRAWMADLRLGKLIAPSLRWVHLPRRVRAGLRVADEGTTLLVNYGREPSRWIRHIAGHSVYTQTDWLLFHAEQVASHFYAAEHSS